MAGSLVNYYVLLGINPDADQQAIAAALDAAQARINKERLYPNRHQWVEMMDQYLARAREALTDPIRRAAYDEELTLQETSAAGDASPLDDVMEIDPPHTFYAGDTDLAYTVAALARKLDTDWPRAQQEIEKQRLEGMLRYVGYGRRNQQRYDDLGDAIARLREQLSKSHRNQLVESVIVRCDSSVERSLAQLNGSPPGMLELSGLSMRPDRASQTTVKLSHAGPRGCLFGHVWVEENWARIIAPEVTQTTVRGQQHSACWFELVPPASLELTLKFESEQLLQLTRPGVHELHISVLSQPETAHETLQTYTLPISLTTIPAKAVFAEQVVALPTVRRGDVARVAVTLTNSGEEPLNAMLARTSDSAISASPGLLKDGGQVEITVNTGAIREGSAYEKSIAYRADGDTPEVTLRVKGEVLPTPWQHIFREQSIRDRLALGLLAALVPLLLSLFPFASGSEAPNWFYWICAALVLAGGSVWVTRVIAHSIVRHMQASGNTAVSDASVPWRNLLLGVGIGTGVGTVLVALLPLGVTSKIALLTWTAVIVALAWGAFAHEQLAIFSRPKATLLTSKPLADRMSSNVRAFVKLSAATAGLVVGGILIAQLLSGQVAWLPVVLFALCVLVVLP